MQGATKTVAAGTLCGSAAALVTVTIWAGWILATRHAAATSLGPLDVGILRFGVPALLLAPVWWRVGLLPKQAPWPLLALMVLGSGAPFFLLAAGAMRFAPAAHVGALLPGAMPLWTALIAAAVLGERFGRARTLGYFLVAAGVLGIAAGAIGAGDLGAWRGHLMLIAAAALWAIFTHAFKRSGLTAIEAAAVVAAWSLLLHLALAAVFGSALATAAAAELMLQVLAQGLLSGLVAIIAYGVAVRRLGAAPASAFSALVPVMTALGGALLLGETLSGRESLAIAAVTLGVALACGPLRWTPRLPDRRATVGRPT